MKFFPAFLLLEVLAAGCGPQASDFADIYREVTATEVFENCDGGAPNRTSMEDLTEVEISPITETNLLIKANTCELNSRIVDDTHFEIVEQVCSVSYEEPPTSTIEVSGSGEVSNGTVEINLSGTYETTSMGFQVRCDYTLTITPSENPPT